jgi:hypothetical protein
MAFLKIVVKIKRSLVDLKRIRDLIVYIGFDSKALLSQERHPP